MGSNAVEKPFLFLFFFTHQDFLHIVKDSLYRPTTHSPWPTRHVTKSLIIQTKFNVANTTFFPQDKKKSQKKTISLQNRNHEKSRSRFSTQWGIVKSDIVLELELCHAQCHLRTIIVVVIPVQTPLLPFRMTRQGLCLRVWPSHVRHRDEHRDLQSILHVLQMLLLLLLLPQQGIINGRGRCGLVYWRTRRAIIRRP
jgi:hypothetical protein